MSARKLTPRQARNVFLSPKNTTQLAKQYKVNPAVIWFIKRGTTYRDAR